MTLITVGDININYKIQGSGEPLLMIMGLSFSLLDWGNKFTELLAKNYQLILFDNRDAGLTSQSSRPYSIVDMADDVAGLLDALNIPKAHVFGVSMGGAIAQQFALKYPDKLDKLILGCTMAGGNCSQMGDIGGVMNGNLLDLLFTPTFIQNHRQELTEFLAETTPLHSRDAALQRQLQAFASHDTCDRLTDIQATTLIITGDKDIAIPRSNSDVLAAKIPNIKLEIIGDAAHGFSFSHPHITADLIHLFLQQPLNPEKTIMQDKPLAILKKFGEYAQIFNLLEPTKVAPFFHLPAMLMTSEQVAVMNSSEEVIGVFTVMMDELRVKNFKESKIIGDLQVTQLSDNQGQVVGVAKRFNDKDEEIEHFGFTYILRKIQEKDKLKDEWTIITGVIHEPERLSE
ncbi:alpha/beta fold hydrolase [Chamaesiphon sp.]|uniref:alpha/beta fold hydrolase n=1 Tax=Chamaesiphon sp. TaxID=2814140 RepID=UPI0035948A36